MRSNAIGGDERVSEVGEVGKMSVSLWAYVPDICDGDFCPGNCDGCYKTEIIIDMMEEENE